MSNAILGDEKERNAGARLQPSDQVGLPQTQQLDADWTELKTIDHSYYASNRIKVINYSPVTRYTVGDKLRIKQGGSIFKYFYVTSTYLASDGTQIVDVIGDESYFFDNTTITQISYSKVNLPSGFQGYFLIRADVTDNLSNNLNATFGTDATHGPQITMTMSGPIIHYYVVLSAAALAVTPSTIYLTFNAFKIAPALMVTEITRINNGGLVDVYKIADRSAGTQLDTPFNPVIDILKFSGNFATGNFSAQFYLPQFLADLTQVSS